MRRAIGGWLAETARIVVLAVITALVVLLAVNRAAAGDAPVSWTHPTTRVDGSALPLSQIKETQLDWAKCVAGSAFPTTIDGTKSVPAPATSTTITGLSYGTWCFRARTMSTDATDNLSANTGTVYKTFIAPPNPPTIVTVGGLVWEMRLHPQDGPYLARVIGTIAPGIACYGMAPQIGFDLFSVPAEAAVLDRKPNPNATLVAQCSISEA